MLHKKRVPLLTERLAHLPNLILGLLIQFLSHIASFPNVYYFLGSLTTLFVRRSCIVLVADCLTTPLVTVWHARHDNYQLLIDQAHCVLVLRDPLSPSGEDKYLTDSRVVLTVNAAKHTVSETKILAELVHRNNMRFVLYDAFNARMRSLGLRFSESSFLHRPAYASGMVFASSMLDTALYQALANDKQGLFDVIQQLVGVGISRSSAALSQLRVDEPLLAYLQSHGGATYGVLCRLLLFHGTHDNPGYRGLPIGVYTTRVRAAAAAAALAPLIAHRPG